jgi:PKD repeat protein
VNGAARGANLDAAVILLDSAGTTLKSVVAVGAVPVTLAVTLPQEDNYFLRIDGAGYGTTTVGYSDYASIGQYAIAGNVPLSNSQAQPPQAIGIASVTTGEAPLANNFFDESFDPDGYITAWHWNFGDGTQEDSTTSGNTNHTYTIAGTYTATLTVTDNSGLSAATAITINVTAAPIVPLVVGNISLSLSSNKSGTLANASILVTKNGQPIPGATVVGKWSGIVSGNVSGVSGTNGVVVLKSPRTKTAGTFTISVTNVSKSGESYDASLNVETMESIIKF